MQDVAADSMSKDDDRGKAVVKLCLNISECEAAAKSWFDMLVDVDLSFFGTGAVVSVAGDTGVQVERAGQRNVYCNLYW